MATRFRSCAVRIWCGLLLALITNQPALFAQSTPDQKLEKAIATLRHIDQSKIPKSQQEAKGKEIDAAWDVIRAAGQTGVARLKEEVRQVDQGKERDDYFKLNATALLWSIGKLDESETIGHIWESTPLTAQYNYVFYTAMEAAATQDARALPMLKAVLRDDQGSVYLYKHALDVRWPLTHEFVWGAYGSKGVPVLAGILETSNFSTELKSAATLLTDAYHTDALPMVRALVKSPISDVRRAAIRSLGVFGHPLDYDLLISGLRLANREELYHYVYALYEYEDLRAVPLLIPFLKEENEFFRREVIATLMHLASPASFDALQEFCRAPKDPQQQGECSGHINDSLEQIGLTWAKYAKWSPAEKEKFFKELRRKSEDKYRLNPGDKRLTHQQLIEAINEWKNHSRAFTGEKGGFEQPEGSKPNQFIFKMSRYGWVEERHVLATATPQDINMLLDARASLYRRLSDECLYEVRRINTIIQRMVRSQYRREVGLTAQSEAK